MSLKEKTAKGLMWGGLSNVVQQLIGVVFGIILGRLLSPDDYGMIAMITIFSLIANELQWSGFKPALTNLKHPSHNDFNSVFWFNITVSVTLYLILFFTAPLIADFYKTPALVPLCRYVFLGFVFAGFGAAQSAYLFKHLMARQQAIAGITAIIVSNTVGVTMAALGYSYWSLATQSLLYILINTILFWYFSPWCPSFSFTVEPLRRMLPFSVKIMFTAIINILNNNVLNVLLGRLYSVTQTGHYNQAYQWNHKASFAIQAMILQVAQPVLVEVQDEKSRELRVLRKLVRFTAFIAFPLMLGLSMVSQEFIIVTITEKWLPSAKLLQIMCISGAFMPLTILFHNCIMSRGRSDIYMWATVALCVVQFITLYFTHRYDTAHITPMVIGFVTVNVLWVLVWQYFVRRLMNYRLSSFLADILPFLLISVAVMTVTYFITATISPPWLLLLTRIVIAAALYIIIMKLAKVVIFREAISFLKSR